MNSIPPTSNNISQNYLIDFKSTDLVDLKCCVCLQAFKKKKSEIVSNIKRNRCNVCSITCASRLFYNNVDRGHQDINCEQCGILFKKRLSQIKKHKHHCCSKNCANLLKRKTKKLKMKETIILKTKLELFNTRKNWQSARSNIQQHARKVYLKSNKLKQCLICGYEKHYEVCHIKDVSQFSDDTFISEINNIDNLIALCPTHHWEFDNGYHDDLKLDASAHTCSEFKATL